MTIGLSSPAAFFRAATTSVSHATLRCRHSLSCGRISAWSVGNVVGVRSSLLARGVLSAGGCCASRLEPARPAATATTAVRSLSWFRPMTWTPPSLEKRIGITLATVVGLFLRADAPQVLVGADEDVAAGDGERGVGVFAQRVGGEVI